MEAWWNDPRSEPGIAKARWNANDEHLTRLAFSWKSLKLTPESRAAMTCGIVRRPARLSQR